MEAPELERRLAAILAADVEGYSRLMHLDEESTMSTLSARRALVDALIGEYRGRIANTAGDSVLAEFASVVDAVHCAVGIQQAMEQANEGAVAVTMRLRIGINVGDVMVKEGDVFGDGVNVAARLEGLAEGGGICVSRGVRDHLRQHPNFAFEDMGEQLVKNIAHPIRAYRLRAPSEILAAKLAEPSLQRHAEPSSENEIGLELALWDRVKDGEPEELASYLEQYPQGRFASLVRTRLNAAEGIPSHTPATKAAEPETMPDALDLAFWDAIKESQRPEELAAYLEEHPDGHFEALARTRLSQTGDPSSNATDAAAAPAGDAIELAFWEGVRDAADPELFAAYIEKYPEGEFVIIARARIEALRAESSHEVARDENREGDRRRHS